MPLPHLMLILRGSTTTPTQQPASFTRNGKKQDMPLEVLLLIGDQTFTLQQRFLLLQVLRWEVSATSFLCIILNRALLLHLLLWSLCSDLARRRGPSRGQILALGEGQDEDHEVEGPEEEAFKHDMRGIKQEGGEEGAPSPQGIVLIFTTRSPWWKIHGGTCCHEHAEKLRHVKAVLEEGGHFSGIYRKVQLKPQKWTKFPKEEDEAEGERPVEALMVLKYGGVLTHAGRKQAEELGRSFRNHMYPDYLKAA